VKEILDNHNGTIFVESEKGKGSIFTVKLPLI
jgi:two-component system phosphate regulon sensor histidine kinase PhoR